MKDVGQPFFTGSDTDCVINVASSVIRNLHETEDTLRFDRWAIESMKIISSKDKSVGFPIQLVSVKESITDAFPVHENKYCCLPEFETKFPIF